MAESSIQRLKDKLNNILHQKDLAAQKAEMLQQQIERERQREQMLTELTHQLMDRQRELNVMLNRANIMLHRAQEANTVLSLEFTELCHALPAPENPEVQERIRRINDLFKTTGTVDSEMTVEPDRPAPAAESVIVTPPPSEPVAEETPIEPVVEEQPAPAPPVKKRVKKPRRAGRLDELFRKSGDDSHPAQNGPIVTPAPITPAEEVVAETPAPPIAEEPEPVQPISVAQSVEPETVEPEQEPVQVEALPAYDTAPPFIIEDTEPRKTAVFSPNGVGEPEIVETDSEPVGATVSEDRTARIGSSRRWWQVLGRR